MITFAKTKVDAFRHANKALRYGQAFHQYMKLDKVSNIEDKHFCDKLYNADEQLAKQLINSRIDNNG